MKYDFDTIVSRRGTDCIKWDSCPDGVIPAWVADMDFKTAPCVIEALKERVEHGVFGYTCITPHYHEAVHNWFLTRHGWDIDPETIVCTTSVVPALSAIIKGMTKPGDRVLIQTPAYNCFFSSPRNNKCEIYDVPLTYHPDGYTIDFEALDAAAAHPDTKLMILCNPHNPVGRVWTRDELLRIADICLKHNVFVISDEIHCELTYPGHDYTPYNTLGEKYALNAAVCVSPSKAFNIAGVHIANIIAVDPEVRQRIDRAINDNEVCDMNPFGVTALIAAYNHGGEWLDQLREYLYDNYLFVRDFFAKNLPQYPVLPLEGTYLVWINCAGTGISAEELVQRMIEEQKVKPNGGAMYGDDKFIRLNIACPRALLADILNRMAQVLAPL